MSLRNLKIARRTVETPGGDIVVRGLTLDDLIIVSQLYGPQAAVLFGAFQEQKSELEAADVKAILQSVSDQLGDLLAGVVALASNDYDAETVQIAKELPFNVTFEVLVAVFELTFTNEAQLKKFVESLVKMVSGAAKAIETVRLPLSEAGSLVGDATSLFSEHTGT